MIAACGKWGFDVDAVWRMTPSEVHAYFEGGKARDREARLLNAKIESLILAFGGQKVTPLELIGEAGGDATEMLDPMEAARMAHQNYLADQERASEAAHRRWASGLGRVQVSVAEDDDDEV